MTSPSRTVSVRDIQEPAYQRKSGVYTHGVLSISSQYSIGFRSTSWFLAVLLLIFPPVLLTFAALSSPFRPVLDALEISPQQYQYIPGALLVLQAYVALLSLCAAHIAFPRFFDLSQFFLFEKIRYHRSHSSHIRLNRFRRLVDDGMMTIFVRGAQRRTIPILVGKHSTVDYVLDTLRKRGHIPRNSQESHSLYMPGRLRRLLGSLTMADLNAGSLSHFDIRVRVLGGASGSNNASSSTLPGTDGTSDANDEGRPQRNKTNPLMAEYLEAEGQDEYGNPIPAKPARRRVRHPQNHKVSDNPPGKGKRKGKEKAKASKESGAEGSTDDDDPDFNSSQSSDSESSSSDEVEILNDELADSLPSKTIPTRPGGSAPKRKLGRNGEQPPRKKPHRSNSASDPTSSSTPSTSATPSAPAPAAKKFRRRGKRNPAYLFFEEVDKNSSGSPGQPGDKHYKCHHGDHHILTVTEGMRFSVNGLTGYLKTHAPPMYRLYEILFQRSKEDPDVTGRSNLPTEEEIEIAAGKRTFDDVAEQSYLANLRRLQPNTIGEAFDRQRTKNTLPWDQERFERLLAEWIVSCDQPFDEVDKAEFRELLFCTHRSSDLHIPGRKAIRERIMAMEKGVKEKMKKMFSELKSRVSISLDAWTSSNGYAFIAIVAHYVTNDGKLEESLIDFRELIGEHSGENMAEAVWETLEAFGLSKRITAFVMDNATNNDTMLESIQRRCFAKGIEFSARSSRLRCMPHTVHLAALKLLESIGAVEKPSKRKTRASSYQEGVVHSVGPEDDEDAVQREDGPDTDDEEDEDSDVPIVSPIASNKALLSAVRRLRRIVRSVRSSPQRRKAWEKEVKMSLDDNADASLTESVLMLILDVKTRWSSTHQMLRRALQYRVALDSFVTRDRDLHPFTLSDDDWNAIGLVANWLEIFRDATTQMSTTNIPMISTTHTVFRGLQQDIRDNIRALPKDIAPQIKEGLVQAHLKLSDYYTKFDESPYYTWAALLDPRISYEGIRGDYEDDLELSAYLETAKTELHKHYNDYYVSSTNPASETTLPIPEASAAPKKRSFTDRYNRRERVVVDELAEYFKLVPEDFDSCDPIEWWFARRFQFPNLHRFALDILSIPGSAVAVERVFSGGRDTISLRRSSLKADTIRTLMLVKNRLRMARRDITARLGD